MKLLFSIFLLISINCFAQYPQTQNLGNDSTKVDGKGAIQSRFINKVFVDTADANTQRIRQYAGAQIYTITGGPKLWIRNANATLWVEVTGSSSGGSTNTSIGAGFKIAVDGTNNVKSVTATNALTADSSTSGQVGFKFGGTGTQNTTVTWGAFTQAQSWAALGAATGLALTGSGTASSNSNTIFSVGTSGATGIGQRTYGAQITNTRTGVGGANVALRLSALGKTGGSYALIVDSGYVGIGEDLPGSKLWIRNNNMHETEDYTSGMVLSNDSFATALYDQVSPTISFAGQGWQTTAPGSEPSIFKIYNLPSQGTAHPGGILRFLYSNSSPGGTQMFGLGSSGQVYLTGDDPGTSGYILKSGGANATASWVNPTTIVTATPTFQQVLTAGSLMTGSNTVTGGSNAFTWTGFTDYRITATTTTLASSVTNGTAGTSGVVMDFGALTSGYGLYIGSNSTVKNGANLVFIESNITNSTLTKETIGQTISITNAGTVPINTGQVILASGIGGVNTALKASAIGAGGVNYAAQFLRGIVSLGTAGTESGRLEWNGSVSGTVSISPNSNFTSYNLVLPADDGNANQFLQTDGAGTLVWATPSSSVTWNGISNPTGTQTLTFDDGELNAWTISSDAETFWTKTANSITSGIAELTTLNGLTSGTAFRMTTTSTALAANNELLDLQMSGANASSSITATGARISVTNTGTTNTNIGLDVTASLASTDNWAIAATGNLRVTSANTTQATTSSAFYINPSALTTGTAMYIPTATQTSGTLLQLVGTSTALAANNEMLDISLSGANATSSIIATAARISVTNTGTTGTNLGMSITASGATNNYNFLLTNGDARIGWGTATPAAEFQWIQGTHTDLRMTSGSSGATPGFTVVDAGASGKAAGLYAGSGGGVFAYDAAGFFAILAENHSAFTGNTIGSGTVAAVITSGGNFGVGVSVTASARIHAISTTTQLRIGYDASNYWGTTVGSTGGTTFDAVGSGALFTFSDGVTINGNLTLGTAGNKLTITEGTDGRVGQTTLVSGTKAITINGLTTSSRAIVTLVTPTGVTLTTTYQAVCTANTLTIQANVAAGTINAADGSTLNYFVLN